MKNIEIIISQAASASCEEQAKILEQLDDQGILMRPDEEWDTFIKRVSDLIQAIREFDNGNIPTPLQKGTTFWKKIPEEFIDEANRQLENNYKFRISWVPSFFSRKETGSWAAGVQLEVDEIFPLIFLHYAFADKNSYCGYKRSEVLAHELTHTARMFFPSSCYEEYFTCHLYSSPVRRLIGNLFRSKYLLILLSMGFFGGALSISYGFAPGSIFFALPLIILLYEINLRVKLKKAEKKLRQLKLDPLPVLLRLSDREIFALAKQSVAESMELPKNSLRWKIFFRKFPINL